MDKNSFLAELLYMISNYEKGRIRISVIWSRKYTNSLYDSISIMIRIIKLMKQNKGIEIEEVQLIISFINKNYDLIFPKCHNETMANSKLIAELVESSCIDAVLECELLDLMETILNRCSELLINKETGYKKKISYLLMALHNIPRVYLDNKKITFFNIGVLPLTEKDAKESAYYYIKLSNSF